MKTAAQRSLFGEILDWMLAPLLLLWPMSLGVTGIVAQEIANRPYDRELAALTRVLARQVVVQEGSTPAAARIALNPAAAVEWPSLDDAAQVYYQVRDPLGQIVAGDAALPPPPANSLVMAEPQFRDDVMYNESVRVAWVWVALPGSDVASAGVLVQQAETMERRARLSSEIIKGVILPQFIILPVAVVLVWLALARGIRPLQELQRRIRRREAGDLSPIDERDVPEEVSPLVVAINDLLQRLDQSLSRQKHFLADAAHQLKTPLAGLRMQAELAAREIDAGQSDPLALKGALRQIAVSSQRAAHSVNQLLSLARAEDQEQALQLKLVDMADITQSAVRDFVPMALESGIDLGYEGAQPGGEALMLGHAVLLRELVRNLVDNALRYTSAGGTVTARVLRDPFGHVVVLQVEDTGPGIAPSERERIFEPFYRALGTGVDGTGLGLSIVREIALRHEAEITVEDARSRLAHSPQTEAPASGPGALFIVRFPVRRA